MDKIKDYILDIVHLNNEYSETASYLGIYFCFLLLLCFFSKDRRHKEGIVYPSLIMLFEIYLLLPFIRRFFGIGLDEQTRARSFWALIPVFVIALGFTLIVSELKDDRRKLLAIAFIVPVIALSGEFKINNNVFQKAENLYKLPQALIDVSDLVLSEKDEPRLIVPYETAHVFRQYSADIKLLYGEDATILRVYPASHDCIKACDQMQTEAPDLNFIKDLAKENDVDYILFDSVFHAFGGNDLNFGGYTEMADFAGDRTASEELKAVTKDVRVIDNGRDAYWDLTAFNMEYAGTFGQYLLYRII
ncbi:MAG: hypothetical protein K5770_09780 [Lachnospiraceae bacterium]|nr:hypothetical protein [Lachnospiraceae bacterium]